MEKIGSVLFASNNKGKVFEVQSMFQEYGLELLLPSDVGVTLQVPETGRTLEDNAAAKARAFRERLRDMASQNDQILEDHIPILSDDTGLSISALNGEPGYLVRRWKDGVREMSDEELVEYCLERMESVPPDARQAEFRTVGAINFPDSEDIEFVSGRLRGLILQQAQQPIIPGLPFDSLFYVPDWQMTLSAMLQLSQEEKSAYMTHRLIAMDKAIPVLLEWFLHKDV